MAWWVGLVCLLFLAACQEPSGTVEALSASATPTFAGALTPYQTLTPFPTATRLQPPALPSLPAAPTPTPFTHQVVQGDTMLGIAFQYGVSLEDLMAANPGVDPRAMSIGLQLFIPLGGEISAVIPTTTPLPLPLSDPACYPEGGGGAWCLAVVENALENPLENLSLWFGLYDEQGRQVASQVAAPLLNLAPAQSSLPVMVYFPPPLPNVYAARASLLTVLEVDPQDARYLPAEATLDQAAPVLGNRLVEVTGQVRLPLDSPAPQWVWVLVVAYDAQGRPVGMRRWEAVAPCGDPNQPLVQPCGPLSYELSVASLASPVERIEVLVEARR